MINFKSPNLEMELNTAHPEIRKILAELADYCQHEDIPAPLVTEVLRSPDDQERIYYQQMMRQFSLTEEAARRRARNKDSMHLYGCALDLRTIHWSVKQKALVVSFLRTAMKRIASKTGAWEFIPEVHGTGPHIHIARKDNVWITEYRAKHDKPFNIVVGLLKNDKEPSA